MSTSNSTQSPRAWWAGSSSRARLSAVGAVVIVAALLATSVFVWSSPQNPVRQAIAGQVELDPNAKLVKDRNALLSQIVALRSTLENSESLLAASETDKAAIQQALWSAEGELEEIEKSRGSGVTDDSTGNSGDNDSGTTATVTPPKVKPDTVTVAIDAPSKAAITNPKSSYFGMYTEQAPFNFATYDATAAKIGSAPNVVGYFGGWDEDFRASAVERAWKRDTLPVLTWESRPIGSGNDKIIEPDYELPDIIGDKANGVAGTFDDYLTKYAKDIVKTGLPLGIRLDHEMNGVWYPWAETTGSGASINNNRVGDYVKMWKHVHDIFEAEGANDLVVWIWAPNITNNLPSSHRSNEFLASLYPGDDYVDWVGLSGYLRPPYKTANNFSFSYTFDASLESLRSIADKPIFLAEIGASETGGHKAKWVTSFFEGLAREENSDIVGFSWFNLAVTSYTEGVRATNDWRIDSRRDSLEAFTTGIAIDGANFDLEAIK